MSEKLLTTRVSHTHQPTKSRRSRVLATLWLLTAISVLCLSAAAQTITFESPTYTLGNINGQDGWKKTGTFDHAVSSSLGTAGFGAQSYRVSNAITSGSFADQTYSRSLANEAGETTAANNGQSGGIRQKNFEMEFNIASTVPGAQQPGLAFSIAPDRGDGARMSYLRFEDQADGIHVIFDDYRDNAPFGTAIGDAANGCGAGDIFTDIDIATLNRATTHTIKFAIFFIDGPRNDVVQIYIDGVLKQTGTTWEDYSRYCQASQPATVDSLLIRTAGTAAAGTAGNGLLFDNMNSSSSTNATPNLVVDDDGLGSAADCNDTSPAYSSISSAVVAANPGDTVRVCSGTYPTASTITLNKAITILGVGPTKPVIQAASTIGNAFFVSASNVTIDNLEIQKTNLANQDLIAVQANNFTAQNNLIYGPNPGAIWNVAGFVSRAFVISNQTGTLITNNVIHTLRQPAYMSGSNNVAAGTISNNQVSGTKGWVVEGGNYTFTGNTWGEPQNQSCDIALLNDPSLNPAFYQPLLALSTANDNAFICAQYVGGENGRATAYVNDGAGPGGNGSDNTNYLTINDGIAGALIGGTVQVAAGTYNEDVTVNKTVKVLGAGPIGTTVRGPIGGAGNTTFLVTANNVEIAGFTITRAGNNTTDWNDPNLNIPGVALQGAVTGMLLRDNLITGMRTGIDINNSSGHTIRNNVIDNNRTGMIFRNQTDNLTVVENTVTNNWTVGILFLDATAGASNSPLQQALNCTFFNNNLSGNWYGQIVDRQASAFIPTPGTTNLKNFSGNWYGTATPVVTTANSAEPGYAAQIPVIYGGSAVPPGGQPDIAGPASANFDYTPLLAGGGDTNVQTTPGRGTYGFQGNFSALNVSATSAQVGATSKIQEAIDLITAGGTLSIPTGTYPGNVNVNKALSINGTFTVGGTFTTSAAGVVISPGYSPGIINTGNLSFGSGTTVNMELNGVIAGTNYDQFNVTGTVNISPNVTLNATVGYSPGAGDAYTIINNDGGDAVTGTFAGLADEAVFFVGANSFRIDYNGGDGNDVVITAVSLCNAVSIPTNITSLTGASVNVPVNVDNTTGNGLFSTDFTLTYNQAVISSPVVTLGTVPPAGTSSLTVNTSTPGTIVVSVFSSDPFVGAGTLVNVAFTASGAPGTSSAVNFTAFKFNEGTPCISTSNGLVSIISGTITGTVSYGNVIGSPVAPRHVPNVTLNAVGSIPVSALTNNGGVYSLSGMGSGSYTVTPSKTGGTFSGLSGLDSALIAQFVVGLTSLNATQQTVADVSGTGGITSFDAALIARYVAALPNSGSSGTWRFTPVNIVYPNVNTNFSGQDYTALLMGDVTGNWFDPSATRLLPVIYKGRPIRVTIPEVSAVRGAGVTVPINISDSTGKGILSYEFDLSYDPAVLEIADNATDTVQTLSDGRFVTVNTTTPGMIKVVVFGASEISGEGALLNLRFNAVGDVGSTTALTWENFNFNEGGVFFRTTNSQITIRTANSDEASISGSLLTAFGKAVPNTRVTLTDTTGATRTVLSNELGSYQFGNVRVGETYTITAASRAFTFTPVTVSVSGNLANVDIIAEQ